MSKADKNLKQQYDSCESNNLSDFLDNDNSPFGRDAFYEELTDIDVMPERTAIASFLVYPEKENSEFVMVLAKVLRENPKLVNVLTKNKMKLSSKLIPDPSCEKPYPDVTTEAWEKSVKSYIVRQNVRMALLRRATKSR